MRVHEITLTVSHSGWQVVSDPAMFEVLPGKHGPPGASQCLLWLATASEFFLLPLKYLLNSFITVNFLN